MVTPWKRYCCNNRSGEGAAGVTRKLEHLQGVLGSQMHRVVLVWFTMEQMEQMMCQVALRHHMVPGVTRITEGPRGPEKMCPHVMMCPQAGKKAVSMPAESVCEGSRAPCRRWPPKRGHALGFA